MSKLIDADKLKEILKGWTWDKIATCAIKSIDEQPEVLLSCPKCHGTGEQKYETGFLHRECLICRGTGKLTIDAYEDYQERCRE